MFFKTLSFYFFFIYLINCYSQVDQEKLNSLKEKYPWGSIYITYTSFINLYSIINDENKLTGIIKENDESVVTTLRSFLFLHKSEKINQSISFIEIDLNRIEAGFKEANDPGGEITGIAWSKEQVVKIADLCDKQLNAISMVNDLIGVIKNNSDSIELIFEKINAIQENPYASEETIFLLSKEFRIFLLDKENELNKIKEENNELYSSIENFKNNFNDLVIFYQDFKLKIDSFGIMSEKTNNEFVKNVFELESIIEKAQ